MKKYNIKYSFQKGGSLSEVFITQIQDVINQMIPTSDKILQIIILVNRTMSDISTRLVTCKKELSNSTMTSLFLKIIQLNMFTNQNIDSNSNLDDFHSNLNNVVKFMLAILDYIEQNCLDNENNETTTVSPDNLLSFLQNIEGSYTNFNIRQASENQKKI